MKILIISQYFWPETFRINEIVTSLLARDIHVDILTGQPNYPDGKIYSGYKFWGLQRQAWNGTNLFRVPLFPRGKRNSINLALNYTSFAISASIFGFFRFLNRSYDVIFVYAPSPLLQALPALFLGWLKRVPVVLYVQDLWPDSLEATGYIKSQLIIRCVKLIVSFIYKRTDFILVSSQPFKDIIHSYGTKAKIIYYPNSVENMFSDPESGLKPMIPELDTGFKVVFAGNVGSAQAVQVIVDAAKLLREYSDIRFIVVGSGSELDWMKNQILSHDMRNLFLVGRYPVEAMPNILSRASALLVTLADRPIFALTVPNKIQAYLAVGRPIVACMNGEGARIVEEAGAGISMPAEDGAALAAGILKLYELPDSERVQMGKNGQSYFAKNFEHEQLIDKLIEYLTHAASLGR